MFMEFAKEMKRIHNEYGYWIGKYVNSPNSVYKWCVSGYPHLVKGVCGQYVPVQHVNSVTGYTDGKTIYVSRNWFHDKFYLETFKINIDPNDMAYTMVGMYDGLLVHEALHILLTEFNQEKLHNIYKSLNAKYDKDYTFKNSFIAELYGIVEDIYIEQYAKRNLTYYYSKVNFMNGIIFHEEYYQSRVDDFNDAVDDKAKVNAIANLMILFKIDYYQNTLKSFVPEVSTILDELLYDLTNEQRIDVVYRILDTLAYDVSGSDKGQEQAQESVDQMIEDGNSKPSSGDTKNGGSYYDYNGKKLTEADIEQAGKAFDKHFDENGGKVAHDLKELEDQVSKDQTNKSNEVRFKEEIKRYRINGDRKTTVKICKPENNNNSFSIDFDAVKDFETIGRIFRQIKARTKNVSPPANKGRIKSGIIHNIVVTDNIMHKKNTVNKKFTEPEVVILLDISGSTLTSSRGLKASSLLEYINNAGYGMFNALKQSNVSCSVYAHTTESRSECSILPVASNRHFLVSDNKGSRKSGTTADTDSAFKSVLDFYHNGNADGTAIAFLNKYAFTEDQNRSKILIVVSDGEPSDGDRSIVPSFYGDALDELVKALVTSIRTTDKHVFSVSVAKNVVESNNYIYGKEWNIDASNPKNYNAFHGLVDKILNG